VALCWQALIVDEAHRLKNQKSATRQALQDLSVRWLLMLSGTPVQNNMKEVQVSIGIASMTPGVIGQRRHVTPCVL
jgi:SNF2 family DNA or RNA helicase